MVVLPDPLGPTITRNSPAKTSSDTSRSASTATSPIWNVLLTFSRRSNTRSALSVGAADMVILSIQQSGANGSRNVVGTFRVSPQCADCAPHTHFTGSC